MAMLRVAPEAIVADPLGAIGALGTIGVAIMAKAPQAGYAKTRLIPALGAHAAARLQRELTLQALVTAQAAQIGPVTLWCAPDANHRFFRALRRCCAVDCRDQAQGDLGTRMSHTFAGQPLVLIGTDCPVLTPTHLHQAATALRSGHDAVFAPAEDGGYALVGLRRPAPEIFCAIDWGSDQVMRQTRQRLASAKLRWLEMPTLWDIDRPDDLARWRAIDPAGRAA